MCSNIRVALHKKITQTLQNEKPFKSSTVSARLRLRQEKSSGKFIFTLPVKGRDYDISDKVSNFAKTESDDYLENVEFNQERTKSLIFQLDRDHYIKSLIDSVRQSIVPPNFMLENKKNVLVEFSSPNIAKPFHVGHLRSTIIGNFIANVNDYFENDVKRINYLGDWGTQFGFIQLGLTLDKVSEEKFKENPIKALYNAYVYANKLAESDPTIADKAKDIFTQLEKGDKNDFTQWKLFRDYTVDEFSRSYSRLGIKFDEYHWESSYSMKDLSNVITEMEKLNLITVDTEGRKVVQLSEDKSVPLVKSDGSSLYMMRDIGAAIDRFEKYKFDAMYYVVDNGQTTHFMNLFSIMNAMKLPWADRLKHVKFGKIRGMSTRKGTAVFLQDILDDTRAVMKQRQIQSPTTKVNLDYDDPSTETLGISAVIINDLKHKRTRDYDFDWNKALDLKGDNGITLQYAHCRLVSLEENCGVEIASECNPALLTEPVAEAVAFTIGQFDEVVIKSLEDLEPAILANYLFTLSHAISRALNVLQIKGEPAELASQRLLLMHTARKILAQGMKLLGLTPLDKM